MTSPVDRLHSEFQALVDHLDSQPSLRSTADDSFRKSLLLASASYFERRLSDHVTDFAAEASNSSSLISAIITQKAIKRQYHTWFDWDKDSANKFYSLFGADFLTFMKAKHRSEAWLDEAVKSFMELGRARNLLVHENFATFAMEKTATEIFLAYSTAIRFVEEIPKLLREGNELTRTKTGQ